MSVIVTFKFFFLCTNVDIYPRKDSDISRTGNRGLGKDRSKRVGGGQGNMSYANSHIDSVHDIEPIKQEATSIPQLSHKQALNTILPLLLMSIHIVIN